jgi:hypothetical protein
VLERVIQVISGLTISRQSEGLTLLAVGRMEITLLLFHGKVTHLHNSHPYDHYTEQCLCQTKAINQSQSDQFNARFTVYRQRRGRSQATRKVTTKSHRRSAGKL